MVAIELDGAHQKRLFELAQSQGLDAPALARRILLDYLDLQALPTDTDEQWAESSVALAPEIIAEENWDEPSNGPK